MGALPGVLPLTDMPAGALYKGVSGGLYPGGTSIPPSGHMNAALGLSAQIAPVNGHIVVLSLGISNASIEFARPPGPNQCPGSPSTVAAKAFKPRVDTDPSKSSRVLIVNGAQGGGLDGDNLADPNDPVWSLVATRLSNAGVRNRSEVQVVWLKTVLLELSSFGPFPGYPAHLRDVLRAIVRNVKAKYPNVKIAYVSSRTRSYKQGGENFAYESGFAYKWLIEDQIDGDPRLRYDRPSGPGVAPLLLWGPYLWANGPSARSDGLTWRCNTVDPFSGDPNVTPFLSDVRADVGSSCAADRDFNHPGGGGVLKVGAQLKAFFKTYPTTAPWFLKTPSFVPNVGLSTSGPTSGPAPLTVTFSGVDRTPAHNITEFAFNFDDGTGTLATSATKRFNSPGVYTVRMTATDATGNTARRSVVVTVMAGSFAGWDTPLMPEAVAPVELTWSGGAKGSFRFVGAVAAPGGGALPSIGASSL